MEYGPDRDYIALMEEAHAGWLRWNERWTADDTGPLYHESGVLMVTRDAMTPGGFEHDSYRMLLARGHRPERMDAATITRRYPAWSTGRFLDGFFHRKGGYAESGAVVAALARQARADGITVCEGSRMATLIEVAGRGSGSADRPGAGVPRRRRGAGKPALGRGSMHQPLSGAIRASGHPVFHLRPGRPRPLQGRAVSDLHRRRGAHRLLRLSGQRAGGGQDRLPCAGSTDRSRRAAPTGSRRGGTPAPLSTRHVSRLGRRPGRLHPPVPVRRHAGRGLLDRTRSGAARADRRRRRQRPRIQVRARSGRSDRRTRPRAWTTPHSTDSGGVRKSSWRMAPRQPAATSPKWTTEVDDALP